MASNPRTNPLGLPETSDKQWLNRAFMRLLRSANRMGRLPNDRAVGRELLNQEAPPRRQSTGRREAW